MPSSTRTLPVSSTSTSSASSGCRDGRSSSASRSSRHGSSRSKSSSSSGSSSSSSSNRIKTTPTLTHQARLPAVGSPPWSSHDHRPPPPSDLPAQPRRLARQLLERQAGCPRARPRASSFRSPGRPSASARQSMCTALAARAQASGAAPRRAEAEPRRTEALCSVSMAQAAAAGARRAKGSPPPVLMRTGAITAASHGVTATAWRRSAQAARAACTMGAGPKVPGRRTQ
mmetsp:Transcript_58/g.105  ORF Transcript_58/g.105 Transcript_58/m.105 type:complete len:229 (+) Transcript_58:222-908(+)